MRARPPVAPEEARASVLDDVGLEVVPLGLVDEDHRGRCQHDVGQLRELAGGERSSSLQLHGGSTVAADLLAKVGPQLHRCAAGDPRRTGTTSGRMSPMRDRCWVRRPDVGSFARERTWRKVDGSVWVLNSPSLSMMSFCSTWA